MKYFQKLFPSATAIVKFLTLSSSDDDSVSLNVDKTMDNVKITVIGANSTDDVGISSPLGKSSVRKTNTYMKNRNVSSQNMSYLIKLLLRSYS